MRRMVLLFSILVCVLLFTGCGENARVEHENPLEESKGIPSMKTMKEIEENVHKVTFESQIIGKDMKFNISLPDGYDKINKYPVLYMFHGYTGTEDLWIPGLRFHVKAKELMKAGKIDPVIIVCPDIENSYGINSEKTYQTLGGFDRSSNFVLGRFEDYLYKELIPFVDEHFPTKAEKESRYAGGMSMGGFAAIHLAFKHPDLFCKVGGHSPAIFLDTFPGSVQYLLYPTEEIRKERDPVYIAQVKDLTDLSVYLDCGDEDSYAFYEGCEELYRILKSKDVNAQYHSKQGKHEGAYWMQNSEEYLLYYAGKN